MTAPRIALAQSGEICPTPTAGQETVCNVDLAAPALVDVGWHVSSMTNQQAAQPFTTGESETGYNLREAHIHHSPRRGNAGGLIVAIHAAETDGSGNVTGVGARQGTLAGANPNADDVSEFTGNISLRPETTYFLVLSATGADPSSDPSARHSYDFPATRLTTESGDTGWSIGDDLWLKRDSADWFAGTGNFILSFALITDSTLRLKLRVFLESALP